MTLSSSKVGLRQYALIRAEYPYPGGKVTFTGQCRAVGFAGQGYST
jgi:hypothetical protein